MPPAGDSVPPTRSGQGDTYGGVVSTDSWPEQFKAMGMGALAETMGIEMTIEDGQIVGTVALHVLWRDLAEIRGLAVHPTRQGQGLGRWLVLGAEREARDLGLPRVFAWTLQVNFFRALGYRVTSREALPPKVWSECNACPFYENCREIAVIKEFSPGAFRG